MILSQLKETFSLKQKFQMDVFWNVASLAAIAVSGIIINTLIGVYRGAEALGIFNQVFAVFIVLSQLSVGGVHFSVLAYISQNIDDRPKCIEIASSGFVIAAILAGVVCSAAFLLTDFIGTVLKKELVSQGIALAIPGVFFFSLSKVLMNVQNSLRHMRAFAIFQALRFIFLLIAVVVVIIVHAPVAYFALSLSVTELVLFLILLPCVHFMVLPIKLFAGLRDWYYRHLSFGSRGFLMGVFSEINTRVDVLMLGYFYSDKLVGVYSFAAMLAEGFSQLPLVLRKNVDPLLGRCLSQNDSGKIEEYSRKIRFTLLPLMSFIGIISVLTYPFLIKVFKPEEGFSAGWPAFGILMVGIVLNSAYKPFMGLTIMGGRPGMYTLMIAVVVLGNIVLNALLIPPLGINGSALATSMAYVFEAVLIVAFARKLFGVRL